MTFQHVLAARQRLHTLGVPHLSFGGSLGTLAGGALGALVAGPAGLIPGAIAGAHSGAIMNGVSHAVNSLDPTNHFQATMPNYTQTNYAPAIQSGQNGVSSGVNSMNNAINDINADAGKVVGLEGAGGLGGVLAQQQGLAGQLQAQANGKGPNPAQEQFKQNTDKNISQEAGTIASARGINPALAARMAATNGAAQQQGAAGTAATLEAQQQIAAQQALAQQQQAEGNTIMGQGSLLSTAGGMNAQAGGIGNAIASQGNTLYGTAVGGQNSQNNTGVNASLGTQQINSGVAASNTKMKAGLEGGVLNAGGGVLAAAMADGGEVGVDGKAVGLAQHIMAMGGQVPGHAAHPGNDPRNDVVPTVLSKGEIVLPNSVTQSPNAPQAAAEFVDHLRAKAHPSYGHVLRARQELAKAEAKHKVMGGYC